MFTDCPGCARQFRIRAEQLSAAEGLVKCGYCGEQFSALGRLRDAPLPRAGKAEHTEPEFTIPGEDKAAEADYAFPEELLQLQTRPAGWFSRLFWTCLILLLLVTSIGQLAWFNRDQVLSRYPQLVPYARQLCERLQCQWIRYRNVGEISLLNRDVRAHPRYQDALLVNATLVNQAKVMQPFPRIQLGLFDTNGKLLAYREFSSDDYLDDSISAEQGMLPEQPVHIVLEVSGAAEEAVSFEFRFL